MAFIQIDTTRLPINHENVRGFCDMQPLRSERRLKRALIQRLRRKFDDGLFMNPHWVVAVVDGVRYRVNGQHSSNMLRQVLDEGLEVDGLYAEIRTYTCDTMHDAVMLFQQMDDRRSSRSAVDIVNAHMQYVEGLETLHPTGVKTLLNAIAWAENNLHGKASSNIEEYVDIYLESRAAFIQDAHKLTVSNNTCRVGVLAASYEMWKVNRPEALRFWNELLTECATPASAATRVLARHLRDLKAESRDTGRKRDMHGTARLYAVTVLAWRAFLEGRTMKGIRYVRSRTGALPRVRSARRTSPRSCT